MIKKCKVPDCRNDSFGDRNECTLHCEKGNYQVDRDNNLLHEFYDKLIEYILSIAKTDEIDSDFIKSIILGKSVYKELQQQQMQTDKLIAKIENKVYVIPKPQSDSGISIDKDIYDYLKTKEIIFVGIKFPDRKGRDNYDYLKLFKYLGGIFFDSCEFNTSSFEDNFLIYDFHDIHGAHRLADTNFFFDRCIFNRSWSIKNLQILNGYETLYQDCIFNKEIYSGSAQDRSILLIDEQLFNDCKFNGIIQFDSTIFKKQVFNNSDEYKTVINNIEISNCTFEDKFVINNHDLNNISLRDSVFNGKFELKNNQIKKIDVYNCNFNKVSDYFSSKFEEFKISKSIFDDFIGFEQCVFSIDDKNKNNPAHFEFVTFQDIVNFRKAIFNNGLDIENINPKEPPNFLGVDIKPNGTNRETFRIVKHSFDSVGNFIEANKFFKLEIEKYQEELKTNMSWDNFWLLLVFWFNKLTSNFGQSWIKPIGWIIFSVTIYSLNKYNYENNAYEIYKIDDLSSSIIIKCANAFADAIIPFQNLLDKDFNLKFISLIYGIFTSILIYQTIIALKRLTKR